MSWQSELSEVIATGLEKGESKVATGITEHSAGAARTLFDPARILKGSNLATADLHNVIENEYKPKLSMGMSKAVKVAEQQHAMTGIRKPLHEIQSEVKKQVTAEVFGPHREAIQAVLKHTQEVNGKNISDTIADNLNIMFQEEPAKAGFNKGKSQFDVDMARPAGDEPGYNTPISPYRRANTPEQIMHKYNRILASGAAGIHALTTGWNITKEHGFMAMPRAVWDVYGPGHEKENIMASDSIGNMAIDSYRQAELFEASWFHKLAPGSAGAWVHKNMFMPFLPAVRRDSILFGASTGKMMAGEATHILKNSTEALEKASADARAAEGEHYGLQLKPEFQAADTATQQRMKSVAAARMSQALKQEAKAKARHATASQFSTVALKSMDIDPDRLREQGFQLSQRDIEKAYYHGANNKVFLDPYDSSPTIWRQSPLFRSIRAFTGYIAKMGKFHHDLYLRQAKQGDFVGIARSLTMDGLVMPSVAALYYEFERLRHGEDWDAPVKHTVAREEATPAGEIFDRATGRKPADMAKATYNTIFLLTKIGAIGNVTGYVRGLNRMNLLERFIPPSMQNGIQLVQDAWKIHVDDPRHPHANDALKRELLSDIPSYGGGSAVAHLAYPIKKGTKKPQRPKRNSKPTSTDPRDFNPDTAF